MEAELLICRLRSQVGELQSVLSYLEDQEVLRAGDYTYTQSKVRQTIRQLRQLNTGLTRVGEGSYGLAGSYARSLTRAEEGKA